MLERRGNRLTIRVPELRQDVLYDLALHIGQPEIPSRVAVSQLLVIDAKKVEHCRVQVMNGDAILNRLESELVGGAIGESALNAASGEPHRVAIRIVISAVTGFRDRR